jgi:protein-disulfide isomerase
MATRAMVNGTPTVFVDGVWDPTRNKYKKLIK